METQKPKSREELTDLVRLLTTTRENYEHFRDKAITQIQLIVEEAKQAFKRYDKSGREDEEALALADERYITYRLLFDALTLDETREIGLMKLPIDDVRY